MRRRSNARWAAAVVAPWCLAFGALVSFTASAGQDPTSGWNRAPRVAALGVFDGGDPGTRAGTETARLDEGSPLQLHDLPDEREPHGDIKPRVKEFPQIDRTRKGDPVVPIRPSLDGRSRWTPFLKFIESGDDAVLLTGSVASRIFWTPRIGDDRRDADRLWPQGATTPASPIATAKPGTTPAARDRAAHGATPAVARAVALSSSTPAQPDALPIAVSAIPRAFFALQGGRRPDYAALINPEKIDSEKRCLAEAVYFEARSEPEAGQAAVAQVVLNRVSSGLYPESICGVVYQNRNHFHGCQFSFACEGKSLRITERDSWMTALRIADSVLVGRTYNSDVGPATHYHANYVKPRWARSLKKMDVIGRHIFYRLFPGQS
jgi:spore germination cell wall hydrolase CwlJ-like protein